ncbi:MAG: hypothetical protein HY508_12075 [Acidobacteria bacterium]|nr:hypothetical protein [Acidobacteriota bacterium]
MENYFNYFTEIEECYRRCRNTPSLLSPLDWALIESWKDAGIPLAAVLEGIESAFAKFQKRPPHIQRVNSLAYCTQQVMKAAEEMQDSSSSQSRSPVAASAVQDAAPFSNPEIVQFLERNGEALTRAADLARDAGQAGLSEDLRRAAGELQGLTSQQRESAAPELEALERRLSALEDILGASMLRASSVDLLADLKAEVARGLGPYRRNMSAAQIESLERQFLKKRLFEHYRVPRMSLFYL